MNAAFEFAAPAQIIFGNGKIRQIGALARECGTKALVVTSDVQSERTNTLLSLLEDVAITVEFCMVRDEPTVEIVRQACVQYHATGCQFVIGIGGGSVIDTGKAIAILVNHSGEPLDYLEVVGKGQKLSAAAVPYIAIPTTAGTGAEVTKNAVLLSEEHRLKVSLRSPLMLPRVALIDPELTLTMPPHITAATGMDALTQVIEPYVSNAANPMTDAIAKEGIRLAARSIRVAVREGQNRAAREDMAMASLFGGLALANAKLGAVHGFAGVIGGMFHAPHGAVCARLLAPVIEANVRALRALDGQHPALVRYATVAQIVTQRPDATAEELAGWVRQLTADLQIAPLGAYGVRAEHFAEIVSASQQASSMKGNPVLLSADELQNVLRLAI
jgi:alcohol dehydrogenase class IV